MRTWSLGEYGGKVFCGAFDGVRGLGLEEL